MRQVLGLLALLLIAGCVVTTAPGGPYGTFDGEWFSPEWKYAFRISGAEGVATLSNSPKYKTGDVMLRISRFDGATFGGSQVFRDGTWQNVTGRLTNDGALAMEGGGVRWTMTRR